jgi:hypothetical protein
MPCCRPPNLLSRERWRSGLGREQPATGRHESPGQRPGLHAAAGAERGGKCRRVRRLDSAVVSARPKSRAPSCDGRGTWTDCRSRISLLADRPPVRRTWACIGALSASPQVRRRSQAANCGLHFDMLAALQKDIQHPMIRRRHAQAVRCTRQQLPGYFRRAGRLPHLFTRYQNPSVMSRRRTGGQEAVVL